MKVSLNLAQEFSNVDLKGISHRELLRRVGSQLGAVEAVTDWAKKFEGAIIVKVAICEKHYDADKLSICRIDDGGKIRDIERGDDGLIQVVCGAPNVRADMFAVWLPVGATVPSTRDSDPFVLSAREIRGVKSNGMLASAHELGISDDHTGIVEITAEDAGKEPVLGKPLSAYFGLDDFVIDCENKMFTHRPDCFGNLGVARELAGISGLQFKSPDWYLQNPQFESRSALPLAVKNDIPDLVPRFMAVVLENVSVRNSPFWLQATLARIGIKPINNVVDITNYVMHLSGQPLHAFDYDKLKSRSRRPSLFPRLSKKGEKLTLLGQKEVELSGEEIVIATDKQAVALAGVMGGAETEVGETTKTIVIEAATFDMYSVRRTSMKHGLFTDAATRYTKGQSPLQNDRALNFAMQKMSELAGAEQASEVFDKHKGLPTANTVSVPLRYINDRLGSDMIPVEITNYLKNVEFETDIANEPDGAKILVNIPFWRMDIEQPEDVVEEVGRLHGYDQLPVDLPKRSTKPTSRNQLFDFKQTLRSQLAARGANEVLTYSFVHGNLLKKTGTDPEKWAFHIRNALSPDLQYYRTSLMPSLLAKVHPNIKAQAGSEDNQFILFEIGQAHVKGHEDSEKLPIQHDRLALVFAADEKTVRSKKPGSAFYQAKAYLQVVASGQAEFTPLEDDSFPVTSSYQKDRSALVTLNGKLIGVVGEFKQSVLQSLKLPQYSAGFEIDIPLLLQNLKAQTYRPLPEFPSSQQDVTFEVGSQVPFADVKKALSAAFDAVKAKDHYQGTINSKDIYAQSGSDTKRLTFRLEIYHSDKTLKTEEVTKLIDDLVNAVILKTNAVRI